VKFILDEIKKNRTITMQDLLEKLKEKYPIILSKGGKFEDLGES